MASFIKINNLGLLLALLLSGCATVEPWQRGDLARPQMAAEPYPLQSSWRSHLHSSREAGATRLNSQGAGCGCY